MASFEYNDFTMTILCLRHFDLGKLISYSPNSEYISGVSGIFFDLGAQSVNMRVDRMLIAVMPVTPDLIQQQRPGVDFAGIARKMLQQVVWCRRPIGRELPY